MPKQQNNARSHTSVICCKACGVPVEQAARGRSRLYCSDECRWAWGHWERAANYAHRIRPRMTRDKAVSLAARFRELADELEEGDLLLDRLEELVAL